MQARAKARHFDILLFLLLNVILYKRKIRNKTRHRYAFQKKN